MKATSPLDAKKAGTVDLPDQRLRLEPRADILQRMVRYQLAKRRAGTAHVKTAPRSTRTTPSSIAKGTGRARHGSRRRRSSGEGAGVRAEAPQFAWLRRREGARAQACAVGQAKSDTLIVIDKGELKKAKTKELKSRFAKLGLGGADHRRRLGPGAFAKAARNLPEVDRAPGAGHQRYDILRHEKLVLTKARSRR